MMAMAVIERVQAVVLDPRDEFLVGDRAWTITQLVDRAAQGKGQGEPEPVLTLSR